MQVIVTGAGLGQRFKDAGYHDPKPIIPVLNKPAIQYLFESFDPNWKVICVLGEHFRETKAAEEIKKIKPDVQVTYAQYSNRGPVDTVLAAVPYLESTDSVAVSYCDFAMVWDPIKFNQFVQASNFDACITSYRGFHPTYLGPNTYAHLLVNEKTHEVQKIQEKKLFGKEIEKEWSSTGFYFFRSVELLLKGLELQLKNDMKHGNEFYTSLAIQALMDEAAQAGKQFSVLNYEISQFMQMGTPADIELIEEAYRVYLASKNQNVTYSNELDHKLKLYWDSLFAKIKKPKFP